MLWRFGGNRQAGAAPAHSCHGPCICRAPARATYPSPPPPCPLPALAGRSFFFAASLRFAAKKRPRIRTARHTCLLPLGTAQPKSGQARFSHGRTSGVRLAKTAPVLAQKWGWLSALQHFPAGRQGTAPRLRRCRSLGAFARAAPLAFLRKQVFDPAIQRGGNAGKGCEGALTDKLTTGAGEGSGHFLPGLTTTHLRRKSHG